MIESAKSGVDVGTMALIMVNLLHMGWSGPMARLVAVLCVSGILISCGRPDEVPDHHILAQEINQSVMCPVCPGESIDQSQHPLAVQMRYQVDERLKRGWTGDQIRAYFVDGYGPSVLLDPPRSGINLVVWIVPPVFVVVTLVVFFFVLRSKVRHRIHEEKVPGLADEERAVYFAQIAAVERVGDSIYSDDAPTSGKGSGTVS